MKKINVTDPDTVTEPSDSHTPDLHPGRDSRLPADRLPHRQRQRSSQGETSRPELRVINDTVLADVILSVIS